MLHLYMFRDRNDLASSSDDFFLGASGLLSLALYARDGRHSQLISANSGIGRPREHA